MVQHVAGLAVVDHQIELLGAGEIDGNGLRRHAAADRRAGVLLLAVDKDAKADAAAAAGRVVDSHLRLEAAPGPIEPIAQPRGAVHSEALQVEPPAAAQLPAGHVAVGLDRATSFPGTAGSDTRPGGCRKDRRPGRSAA